MIVTVVSKSEHGHRRAGRFWPTTPVTAEVTEAQLRELKADKRLAVLDGSAPAAEAVVEKLSAEKAAEKAEAERQAAERGPGEKRRGGR